MQSGDVLLADRAYLRTAAVSAATQAGAHLLVRMRWRHPAMKDPRGRDFNTLAHAESLRVGQVGDWPVVITSGPSPVRGRVVATRLPAPLAEKALRRMRRAASKKQKTLDPRSLRAAHFVVVFTTLPSARLSAKTVLELYRFRWQVELAFKRLKQLLSLGHLPHKDPRAAEGWILAKLVLSLLLETLHRNAGSFSPWGYDIQALAPTAP